MQTDIYTWASARVASSIEMCKAIVGEVEMACWTVDWGVGSGSMGGVYHRAREWRTLGRGPL